ncbi:uncharacterized protein LOC108676200 [Hyalella azteca]|uniref:Uncharacterized protein LOC108676200 n=1 Tax=Hyalella azteca TaxID=294128 RepID=A0A8B7P1A0_HYAAZ|nr:uncharacterized protein LOC108676200 [Hyalella azteca]
MEIRDAVQKNDCCNKNSCNSTPCLKEPLETLESFLEFEDKLSDQEFYDTLKEQMQRIGGLDVADNVKTLMKRTMSNALMSKMSLQGKKNKIAFNGTRLFSAIKEVVMATFQEATEVKLNEEFSRFLRHAPERLGGGGRTSK